MRVMDAVGNLAQLSGRFKKSDAGPPGPEGSPSGPRGQLETRLAGVLVAALKEAFDRDRARMDLERAHLEADQARAEAALRAELHRQSTDRALGLIRLNAMVAVAVWIVSAVLGAAIPGMRSGGARLLLGGGWLCAIAALGSALFEWQRISGVADELFPSRTSHPGPGIAARTASWLLLGALALSGGALLVAL
jgi:hypothetical protein